ncbi:hypothetical protein [Clostridium sp. 1001275B_160808_H3]|uniref:hypothetical protein n=1 Tax=Clostridium sp. 1001275B_160808_H3 TaxID=2787110 RepID=UPI00189B1EAE|nr:hypothetical protein [Clostridium sp. 1001275B_160808_H3]
MIKGKKVYIILLVLIMCGWYLIKENNNKVSIRGLVRESYPVQVDAKIIRVK